MFVYIERVISIMCTVTKRTTIKITITIIITISITIAITIRYIATDDNYKSY